MTDSITKSDKLLCYTFLINFAPKLKQTIVNYYAQITCFADKVGEVMQLSEAKPLKELVTPFYLLLLLGEGTRMIAFI